MIFHRIIVLLAALTLIHTSIIHPYDSTSGNYYPTTSQKRSRTYVPPTINICTDTGNVIDPPVKSQNQGSNTDNSASYSSQDVHTNSNPEYFGGSTSQPESNFLESVDYPYY